MASSIPIDLLLVSAALQPDLRGLEAALNALRLGTVAITVPDDAPPAERQDRIFAGRVIIHETLARVDLTIEFARHHRPALTNMPADLLARLTRSLEPEWLAAVRGGTLSADLHAQMGDSDRVWCLRWVTRIAATLASHLHGVMFDPAAQRLLGAEAWQRLVEAPLVEQIALHREPWGPETRWLHTHGLQKLGQPELDLVGVPQLLEQEGAQMLRQVVDALAAAPSLAEPLLRPSMRVTCDGDVTLLARGAQPDAEHAATWGRLHLVTDPPPGLPIRDDASAAVIAYALFLAHEAQARDDWAAAARRLDRMLAAAPEHPGALATRAEIWLRQGEPQHALEVASNLSLLAPDDARGPFWVGQALVSLGRFPEALAAFSRAILLAPDQAYAFAWRAHVYDRLGMLAEAQTDRARANSLQGEG